MGAQENEGSMKGVGGRRGKDDEKCDRKGEAKSRRVKAWAGSGKFNRKRLAE